MLYAFRHQKQISLDGTSEVASKICSILGSDCSFTQKPIDGKLHKIPCLQFSFSNDNTILSESVESAVNLISDSVCSVLLDTIIKGIQIDLRIRIFPWEFRLPDMFRLNHVQMKIHFLIEVIFYGPHVAPAHVEGIVLIEEIVSDVIWFFIFIPIAHF
jgi:hypothetical protein